MRTPAPSEQREISPLAIADTVAVARPQRGSSRTHRSLLFIALVLASSVVSAAVALLLLFRLG